MGKVGGTCRSRARASAAKRADSFGVTKLTDTPSAPSVPRAVRPDLHVHMHMHTEAPTSRDM